MPNDVGMPEAHRESHAAGCNSSPSAAILIFVGPDFDPELRADDTLAPPTAARTVEVVRHPEAQPKYAPAPLGWGAHVAVTPQEDQFFAARGR